MKWFYKYTGVVFATFFTLIVQAQDEGIITYSLDSSSNRLQGKLLGEVYTMSHDANAYFLQPQDWMPGTVTLNNGQLFEALSLRFEASENQLIAYNENGRFLYRIEKDLVKGFSFTQHERTFNFIRITKNKNQQTNMYFQEVYKGSMSLLVKWFIYERSVIPYVDRNGLSRATEYELNKDYYLYSEDSGFQKIKLKNSAVYSSFPHYKKEIRKLFRQNNIDVKEEQSMVSALMLLDENGLLK
ncbi:MAG TPA: hypothetical protein VEP89_11460 [Draconibacterium sp.]|nr:hypothetical protein [Draconibacterium sp.]